MTRRSQSCCAADTTWRLFDGEHEQKSHGTSTERAPYGDAIRTTACKTSGPPAKCCLSWEGDPIIHHPPILPIVLAGFNLLLESFIQVSELAPSSTYDASAAKLPRIRSQ